MKIISWNVNGVRSLTNFDCMVNQLDADIICLQEIKANQEQMPILSGYGMVVNSAQKPGYSGVAIYYRIKPESILFEFGLDRFDSEGRYIELDFADWRLINIYMPHGGRDKSKLGYKLDVYHRLLQKLQAKTSDKLVIVGDFNIAHRDIDVCRAKQNHHNIMYTDIERTQIDNIIKNGFVDAFRYYNVSSGHYTWWPYAYNARKRNVGWRIDYIFINNLLPRLKRAQIYPDITGSDHCPIGIELDIDKYNKKI